MNIKQYIGTKSFYKTVVAIAIPIMIQNGITNLVNLLDNIMVGSITTEAMNGVSIINQYTFVFNLLTFGAVSAAGIFTAQYFGSGDYDGVRHTFRLKFMICVIASALSILALYFFDETLVNLFISEGSIEGSIEDTMRNAKDYLKIMLWGLAPYAISQAYASTMRETNETLVPMISSIVAVAVNFVLNGLLIFGLFGFPRLEVKGAAVATVVSRFAELGVLVVYAHLNKTKCGYMRGVFKSFRVPVSLLRIVAIKGMPLVFNEFFWSLSITFRNQCYSTRGLDVVAGQNIASTVMNVFNIVYISMGTVIAIMVGNLLGAGKLEEAKDTDKKLIALSIVSSSAIGVLLIGLSFIFPYMYNTTSTVRGIATYMMIVYAFCMPTNAYANASYFTIRSGGNVLITVLSDSVFNWVVVIPVSIIFAYLTNISIYWLFPICQAAEALKAIFGWYMVRKETWVRRLVDN